MQACQTPFKHTSCQSLPFIDHTHSLTLALALALFRLSVCLSLSVASAGMVAGFCSCVASNPIDVVKSRVMNEKMGGGEKLYKGSIDCLHLVCHLSHSLSHTHHTLILLVPFCPPDGEV